MRQGEVLRWDEITAPGSEIFEDFDNSGVGYIDHPDSSDVFKVYMLLYTFSNARNISILFMYNCHPLQFLPLSIIKIAETKPVFSEINPPPFLHSIVPYSELRATDSQVCVLRGFVAACCCRFCQSSNFANRSLSSQTSNGAWARAITRRWDGNKLQIISWSYRTTSEIKPRHIRSD